MWNVDPNSSQLVSGSSVVRIYFFLGCETGVEEGVEACVTW